MLRIVGCTTYSTGARRCIAHSEPLDFKCKIIFELQMFW